MENEKKQIARDLFIQGGMTKTQIANILNVSRRSITYWVKEGNWNRLKDSANHLPSLVAEKCYHIFDNLADNYLSEHRISNPVSPKEIDGLHKLSLTINKLKNRSTLNETMEMLGFFLEGLKKKNPKLAEEIAPYIEEYISNRAGIYTAHVRPDNFNGSCDRIPWVEKDNTEELLDYREFYYSDPDVIKFYEESGEPFPSEEEISTLPSVYKERLAAREKAEKEAEELRELEEVLKEAEAEKHTPSPTEPPATAIPPTNTRDNNRSEITYITSLSQLSCSADNIRIPMTTDPSIFNPALSDSLDNTSLSDAALSDNDSDTTPIPDTTDTSLSDPALVEAEVPTREDNTSTPEPILNDNSHNTPIPQTTDNTPDPQSTDVRKPTGKISYEDTFPTPAMGLISHDPEIQEFINARRRSLDPAQKSRNAAQKMRNKKRA